MKKEAKKKKKRKSSARSSRNNFDTLALIDAAKTVRMNAYAPYSKYKVGAAFLTKKGNVYIGCNVENASYGGCICAERGALMQMIAAGDSSPVACAIVTQGAHAGSPCGICRQFIAEFANDMPITLVGLTKSGDKIRKTTLAKLLPDAFRPSHLNQKH